MHSMEKPSSTFIPEPRKVYDKQSNMLTWYVTESGIVNVWLQHGASESYKLTDINGRMVKEGDLKDGRVTFTELERAIYTIHVNTAKGTIRKEIDIQ
jgi:hypothetical protein